MDESIPVKSSELNSIHERLQNLIFEKGWKDLSDIQKAAISVILSNADCIIEAPTAGGKTEAVFFPVLTRSSGGKKSSVQILYLAPLRALLNDIELRIEEYSEACGLHCFKWHGDVGQNDKIEEFKKPSQLLLTTPESLEAIMLRKAGWNKFFADLEVIIIDEAHNFASGDRGSHLITLLERLEKAINKQPQRIAISATIGNPDDMLNWLAGQKRKRGQRVKVVAKEEKQKEFNISFFNEDNDKENNPASSALNRYFHSLYQLLPNKKSIVFGGSRTYSEKLATAINQMNVHTRTKNPVRVRTHHSAVSKFYREEAENLIKMKSSFGSGLEAIISTSTLELGIDVGELDQVIQAGALSSSSAFLQRVGRTGRRPNKPQVFHGLCLREDDLILLTAVVSLGLKGISDKINFPTKAYHILAHQLICLSLQNNGIKKEKAWNILSTSHSYSNITFEKFKVLIDFMVERKFLRKVDELLIVGEECEKNFLGANWRKLFAVFDSSFMYDVWSEKKHIGTLDAAFVEALELPFFFVLGGIEWEAIKIKYETRELFVRKTKIGDAPKWIVYGGMEVPYETAKEVGKILFGNEKIKFLNKEAEECILSRREKLRFINWFEEVWSIILLNNDKAEIWTFAGDRINKTLAKLLTLYGIGLATSSYQRIEVRRKKKNEAKLDQIILEFLERLKSTNEESFKYFEIKLLNEIRATKISKFTKLLPEQLWHEAVAEQIFDLDSLIKEILNKKLISNVEL